MTAETSKTTWVERALKRLRQLDSTATVADLQAITIGSYDGCGGSAPEEWAEGYFFNRASSFGPWWHREFMSQVFQIEPRLSFEEVRDLASGVSSMSAQGVLMPRAMADRMLGVSLPPMQSEEEAIPTAPPSRLH